MAVKDVPRLLFVFGQPSEVGGLAEEGLDALLVAASFEVEINVVFVGPGILHLARPEKCGREKPAYTKTFGALADFGVDRLYLYTPSMVQRHLEISDMQVVADSIGAEKLKQLLHTATTVFSF